MDKIESVSLFVALAGVAWVLFTRHSTETIMPATAAAPDASGNVPWYLNYNVASPQTSPYSAALPFNAAGIQNDPNGSGQCAVCSLFGGGWSSQY